MFQTDTFRTFCTTLLIAVFSALSAGAAEHPYLKSMGTPPAKAAQADTAATVASPAPLPEQILSAKKIFISNAGGELSDWFNGGPNRVYNEFYADMKQWGRYELVPAPAGADLIFEIRASGLYLSEQEEIPKFELNIYDPKTHVVLWAFAERLDLAMLKGHRDENFDKGMKRLMARVRELVEPSQ